MNKETALKALEFPITHIIYSAKQSDLTSPDRVKELINAWDYIKENLK